MGITAFTDEPSGSHHPAQAAQAVAACASNNRGKHRQWSFMRYRWQFAYQIIMAAGIVGKCAFFPHFLCFYFGVRRNLRMYLKNMILDPAKNLILYPFFYPISLKYAPEKSG